MWRVVNSLRQTMALIQLTSKSSPVKDSWNSNFILELSFGQIGHFTTRSSDVHHRHLGYGGLLQDRVKNQLELEPMSSELDTEAVDQHSISNAEPPPQQRIGRNVSSLDKRKFLVNTLLDLKDSKEAVYGTLDAWVAWEQEFPLSMLKRSLLVLEKEEQWHRVVQVLKWMLSKGQGTTMGTYEQLIRALEKDGRPEEAHNIWVKKVSHDLHSVPWRVCDLMISIYYRNNMLERLVKLFKGLEEFDRKPPRKSIVRKVADAFEMLGLSEEKNRVLEKYSHLFNETSEGHFKKSRKALRKKDEQLSKRKQVESIEASQNQQVDSGPSDAEIDVPV